MKLPSKKSIIIFCLSLGVILVTVWPLIQSGYPVNDDQELYLVWLSEFDQGIHDGQWLPRWVPDVWVGYGSPLFNFNQPLFFYIAELFHLVGFSLVISVKITLIFSTLLAFWFMYLLSRQFFGQRAGLIAASFYIMAPYHIGLIYSRGAFSEYLAMALAPALFLIFYKLGRQISYKLFFLGGIIVALLLLSHNISALFYLPALALFILLFTRKSIKNYLISIGSIGSGFLLSAFFWLPAFFERQHLRLQNLYEAYNYNEHFVSFKDLLFSHYWENNLLFYQVSFIASLAIIISLILALKNWKNKTQLSRLILFFIFIAFIGIFFTNAATRFIWDNISLMKFIQFPWRFLSLVDFGTAFLIGVIAWPSMQKVFIWIYKQFRPISTYSFTLVTLVIFLVLIWFFSQYLKPAGGYLTAKTDDHYTPHQLIVDQLHTSQTINTFIYKTAIFPKYNNFEKLEERANNVVYEIYYALLEGRDYQYKKYEVLDGRADISIIKEKSTQREFEITATSDSRIMIETFWFPGWQASLDGQNIDIRANEDFGFIEVNIPMGQHSLTLKFKNTPVRIAANYISLFSLIGLLGVGIVWRFRRNKILSTLDNT